MKGVSRDIIRPCIYRVFTRLIYGTTLALLVRFFSKDTLRDMGQYAFALLAALSLLGAWLNLERLRGAHIPGRIKWHLPKRKRPIITYGDLEDHIDDEIVRFDDLDDNEQSACAVISDTALMLAFGILSIV